MTSASSEDEDDPLLDVGIALVSAEINTISYKVGIHLTYNIVIIAYNQLYIYN